MVIGGGVQSRSIEHSEVPSGNRIITVMIGRQAHDPDLVVVVSLIENVHKYRGRVP